jgi:hypothetical protein
MRYVPSEEVLVPVRRHPLRASEVALPCAPRPFRLAPGIDMEHEARDLLPVGALAVGVEQSKVGDQMLVVLSVQHGCVRCAIGDRWINDGFCISRLPLMPGYSGGWTTRVFCFFVAERNGIATGSPPRPHRLGFFVSTPVAGQAEFLPA